ncbi:MAG: hypothetical protein GF344_13240, partial [Chitinivibrionales bacterium]|nr:hypothetical protein [Chitinivibrionales bacterium]
MFRLGRFLYHFRRQTAITIPVLLALVAGTAAANTLWLPEGGEVLRGVRIWFDSPSCEEIDDYGYWQSFARQNKYGLLCLDNTVPRTRSAVQTVLNDYANDTGHPELSHVPFVAIGFSWSSGYSVAVSRAIPERCVALVPSGISVGGDDELYKIPLIKILHEGNGLEQGFEDVNAARAHGALWGGDPRYNGFHKWANNAMMVLLFYDYCNRYRVPLTENAVDGPVTLRDFREEEGWIIPRDRKFKSYCPTVAAVGAYDGQRNNDQWFPSEYIAKVSRSYNVFNDGLYDSTKWEFYDHWLFGPYYHEPTTPSLRMIYPSSAPSQKSPNVASYGRESHLLAEYTGSADVEEVVIYDGDMPLKRFESGPYSFMAKLAPGYHGIYAEALLADGSRIISGLGVVLIRRPDNIETRIVRPPPGDRPLVGTDLVLEAEAVTDEGTISRVEFFVDGQSVGEDTEAPYQVTWNADAAGGRVISAKVFSDGGDSSEAFPIKLAVVEPSVLT